MPTINFKQAIVFIVSALGFIAAAGAQLDPLIGHGAATVVVSVAALANGFISATLVPMLSNTANLNDAAAAIASKQVAGVDRMVINKDAGPRLALLATDPAPNSIEPAKGQETAIAKIAEGSTQ